MQQTTFSLAVAILLAGTVLSSAALGETDATTGKTFDGYTLIRRCTTRPRT